MTTWVRAGSPSPLTCILQSLAFTLPFALAFGTKAWPAWGFLVTWAILGSLRLRWEEQGVWADCWMFGLLSLRWLMKDIWAVARSRAKELEWMNAFGLGVAISAVSLALTVLYLRTSLGKLEEEAKHEDLPEQVKPLFIPCRTTHARMFPKKHAFEYSYLQYGIPITKPDIAAMNRKGTRPNDSIIGTWWLGAHAEDYLFRGEGELGFGLKLNAFLRLQGVDDADWSYAYLVTAPRFLGYAFNPVSFWYIYKQPHDLKHMILEVNNTFGERRIYLLNGSSSASPPGGPAINETSEEPEKNKFTDTWPKDFHVSPFNSRKGAYALRALSPFPHPREQSPYFDNTITLKSSKDHAKIVARLFSTGAPISPSDLGLWGTLEFVASWWWVGFVTFPRILHQAGKLFFDHSLHVWFRPEVLPSGIGRLPSTSEIALYEIFERYLRYIVNASSSQWNITLHTAIPSRPQQMFAPMHIPGRHINPKKLEIRVLTPAFYSRFVHYRSTSEAFDREGVFTDEKNRTVWISNPELLPQLLPKSGSLPVDDEWTPKRGILDEARWSWMRKLRCEPTAPAYPASPSPPPEFQVVDIRSHPFSELDTFVRSKYGRDIAGTYRTIVTKLFLSRFTFRFPEAITALDLLLRFFMSYIGSGMLSEWAREAANYGLGRYLELPEEYSCVAHLRGAYTEWYYLFALGCWVFSCHLYGMSKGYR